MTCRHWRKCRRINTTTWRLHRKAWRKTDYSHQKQYWLYEDHQNDKNQKTKMGRKTILSECSKFAQKEYKSRHDWVSKGIHWRLCKKFKFDHTNKCYMHNPTSVLENDTYKLLCGFDIQTDHLISVRRPDLIIIKNKKENLQNYGLYNPGWPQSKMEEIEKKDKYLNLARELKKLWNMKVMLIPTVIGALGTVTLVRGAEDL